MSNIEYQKSIDVERAMLAWIQRHRLVGADRMLAAVSGGADSTAMAVALNRLVTEGHLNAALIIGHINHNLRGAASDEDEQFVRSLAASLSVPFASVSVDVTGYAATHTLSIETAARRLRIAALTDIARAEQCAAVAVGHHADDQAETLIHRLMRGTGLRGLCGMHPSTMLGRMRFIRPMLALRRADIVAYCRARGIKWQQDDSNRSCVFTRNHIRHRLMPQVQSLLPDAVESLAALSAHCRAAQERIARAADGVAPVRPHQDAIIYQRARFAAQSPWVQAELLNCAVQMLGGGLRDITRQHYEATMRRAADNGRMKTDWPGGLTVVVGDDAITLHRPCRSASRLPQKPVALNIGDTVHFGPYRVSAETVQTAGLDVQHKSPQIAYLRPDGIDGPLTLRPLAPGDRFCPLGLGADKKAARFLLDAKVDKAKRADVFVLCDTTKILWLAPVRLDERAKLSTDTKTAIKIVVKSDNPPASD